MAKVNFDKYQVSFMDYATDIAPGCVVVIETEAVESGQYRLMTCVVRLQTGAKRKVSFNKSSLSHIVTAWGDESAQWVDKQLMFALEDIVNPQTKQVFSNARIWKPI